MSPPTGAFWVTLDQVADAVYAVGWRGEAAAVALAVAKAESGQGAPAGHWCDIRALGDLTIQTDVYGPSVGAWQIRTVKADTGKGTTRDINAIFGNLPRQAQAAYTIVGGNTTTGSAKPNRGWGHWSTWKDGTFRRYLDTARAAVKRREAIGGGGSVAGGGTTADTDGGTDPFGFPLPAGAAAATGNLGSSPNSVTRRVAELPLAVVEPRTVRELAIVGSGRQFTAAEHVIDGDVDLTISESSELALTLANPARYLVGAGTGAVTLRGAVDWRGLVFTIAATELGDGPPGEGRVTVQARDRYIDRMKRTNVDQAGKAIGGDPAVPAKNISPTEYAELMAFLLGLRFMGEGSPRRADITPTRGDDGIFESPWQVLNRLADELGYLCFVSGDVLYYGRPSFLKARGTKVKVALTPRAWGDHALDIIGEPRWRDTVDNFYGATLTVNLPRWRGEQVRPGMVLLTAGGYGLGVNEWFVTRVSWPVDNGSGPVVVEANEGTDPIVKAATSTDGVDPSAATPPSTSSSSSSSSRGGRIGTEARIRLFGQPGDRQRTTVVRTPWGIDVTVHRDVEARFRDAMADAAKSSSWKPRRIDSYAVRNVRGSDDLSLHSFGLAYDFFSSAPGVAPPGGVWAETSAPDKAFRDAFKRHGFYLGAEFSGRKDYPHIEWAAAPPAQ